MCWLDKTTDFLVEQNCIKEEERELYAFGLNLIWLAVINVVLSIVIGMVFRVLPNTLLFLFLFIPLRSFAGGYHAKSPISCAVASQAIILVAGIVSKKISGLGRNGILFEIIILVFGMIQVIRQAPESAETKPLNKIEIKKYRKIAMILSGLECITAVICYLKGQYPVAAVISCVIFTEGVLLTEILRRKKNGRTNSR